MIEKTMKRLMRQYGGTGIPQERGIPLAGKKPARPVHIPLKGQVDLKGDKMVISLLFI